MKIKENEAFHELLKQIVKQPKTTAHIMARDHMKIRRYSLWIDILLVTNVITLWLLL